MKKSSVFVAALVSVVFTAVVYGAEEKAELVLRHGRIYTMDAARSWAEAVAIHNGRFVYVGPDRDVQQWIGESTKIIELSGRFVLPGFIDSHVHPISAGIEMTQLSLGEMQTKEEILQAIQEYARSHPKDSWVLGNTWQLPVFPEANPHKDWLDRVVPDRPALMSAADGHSVWVNSKALKLAGITKDTPDPENGRIERDEKGEPSGTLRESASDLVYKVAPDPTPEDRVNGLQKAVQRMNRLGITGFQDASVSEEGLMTYREAEKKGILTARVTAAQYADPEQPVEQVEKLKKLREEHRGKYYQAGAAKIFSDGVIEANTAALLQPYLDGKRDLGDLNWEPEKLNPLVRRLDEEKFQIHIHAIGDRGIRVALDALDQARQTNGTRDARPVIAHLELIDPADIPRFQPLSVIASFQPLWAYEDPYIKDLTLPKLGPERSRWIYPIMSVAKTGAILALGSDWSVSSVNPLDGIEVAVTRCGPNIETCKVPFLPMEKLDLPSALAAYTISGAYANFWEKETGSIEKGKSADLIVLSENLFAVSPEKINETKVLLTLFEGKAVYRDSEWR